MTENLAIVPVERIEKAIIYIRGQKVMLDSVLAELYGVETRALNQTVKRNIDRFPDDFMFQLTDEEWEFLSCQIGISNLEPNLKSQFVISSSKKNSKAQTATSRNWGGRRILPFVFTEQGVAMLSSAT